MHVLVVGGAGYVGSHAALALATAGHQVTVLDNLSLGHREAVRWGPLVVADLEDFSALRTAITEIHTQHPIDAVMHFGAYSRVGESGAKALEYYANNVGGTLNLLQVMRELDINRLVFSSTAAVYGAPLTSNSIIESDLKAPINPYGHSKLMVEQVLRDAAQAYGLRSVAFRYFNAAGAAPAEGIGDAHPVVTHLLPNILDSLLDGGRALQVFGDDYPTPDGTCVRDYVHVRDLADAHVRALDYLDSNDAGYSAFNLGSANGFSVLEVINAVQDVTGREVKYQQMPRRDGDPPFLVASPQAAIAAGLWEPRYSDLPTIIASQWQWRQTRPF